MAVGRLRRPTIRDVAHLAEVSITTVSNALNGRTHAMTPATLERIRDAMRVLDYHPSSMARGLVQRRSATIGIVIAEIGTPLFLQALTVIEPRAREAGYNVLLCTARTLDDEQQATDLCFEKDVDGLIFLSTSVYAPDDHLLPLQAAGIPIVLVNRAVDAARFDGIDWDDAGGVASAVMHLARLGHRRIAHLVGPRDRRASIERLKGYTDALQACGLPFREEYVCPGDYTLSPDTWQRTTRDLLALPSPPSAIIASDDIVAAVVMRTVRDLGLYVPRDVAVIGVDDQPFSVYVTPSLSTVQLPIMEAGRRAIDLLLSRLREPRLPDQEGHRVALPCPLIVRESCGSHHDA